MSKHTQALLGSLRKPDVHNPLTPSQQRRHDALAQKCLRFKGDKQKIPTSMQDKVLAAINDEGTLDYVTLTDWVKANCGVVLTRTQMYNTIKRLRSKGKIPQYSHTLVSLKVYNDNIDVFV